MMMMMRPADHTYQQARLTDPLKTVKNISYPCDYTVTLVALDTIIVFAYLLTYTVL